MDSIENKEKTHNGNPVVGLLQEIETDILALLKENAELKARIAELSKVQSSTEANKKIVILEEELRKLKKIVTELQGQEDNSRERINQLRKVIQEELTRSQSKSDAEEFGPKVAKSAVKKPATHVDSPIEEENIKTERIDEGEVGYSPYISEDEGEEGKNMGSKDPKDPIGYDFFEDDITKGPSTEDKEEEVPNYKEFAPDAPKELIKKSMAQKPVPVTENLADRPKIPLGENPNAFLISESDKEEDPFALNDGQGESQVEDDDFFKLSNQNN